LAGFSSAAGAGPAAKLNVPNAIAAATNLRNMVGSFLILMG